MMKILAYQHVFSNVPKEQSPTGRRGYQTLFYSQSGLQPGDISILEERAQYIAGEKEVPKYQFYSLADNRAVISRTVPLPEPDEFGRKGRYLTHNLVIPAREFAAVEYYPIGFFMHKNFINRIEDASKLIERSKTDLPPKQIDFMDSWQDAAIKAARSWPVDQLTNLARVGWQAAQLRKNRQTVQLFGPISQIMDTLNVIFLLTEPTKRIHLTFDSYVNGCDWTREWPFWVWGDEHAEQAKNNILIDSTNRKVYSLLLQEEDNPFEKWVSTRAIPEHLEYYIAHRDQVLQLSAVILSENPRSQANIPVDTQLTADFAQMNARTIAQKVISGLDGLSSLLLGAVEATVQSDPQVYLSWLINGVRKASLADLFYRLVLININESLPPADRKMLTQLAEDSKHPGLKGLLLMNKKDLNSWKKTLEQINADDYKIQIAHLLRTGMVKAADAFSPPHLQPWCELAYTYIHPGDIKQVLEQLSKSDRPYPVDYLGVLWQTLSPEDQKYLRQWIKSYPGHAPQLRRFFESLPEKKSSTGDKIKSLFSGEKKSGKKKGNWSR